MKLLMQHRVFKFLWGAEGYDTGITITDTEEEEEIIIGSIAVSTSYPEKILLSLYYLTKLYAAHLKWKELGLLKLMLRVRWCLCLNK